MFIHGRQADLSHRQCQRDGPEFTPVYDLSAIPYSAWHHQQNPATKHFVATRDHEGKIRPSLAIKRTSQWGVEAQCALVGPKASVSIEKQKWRSFMFDECFRYVFAQEKFHGGN